MVYRAYYTFAVVRIRRGFRTGLFLTVFFLVPVFYLLVVSLSFVLTSQFNTKIFVHCSIFSFPTSDSSYCLCNLAFPVSFLSFSHHKNPFLLIADASGIPDEFWTDTACVGTFGTPSSDIVGKPQYPLP